MALLSLFVTVRLVKTRVTKKRQVMMKTSAIN